MPRPLGPPVIIPEEGLRVPPELWQVIFILIAPILAATAIALPVIIVLFLGSTAILQVYKLFDPPGYNPPLLYPKDESNA